jgi:hypothetical protein
MGMGRSRQFFFHISDIDAALGAFGIVGLPRRITPWTFHWFSPHRHPLRKIILIIK